MAPLHRLGFALLILAGCHEPAPPDAPAPDLSVAPTPEPDLAMSCDGSCAPAATCNDRASNGDETDMDCGGAVCPKCALGQGCASIADCATGRCEAGRCAAAGLTLSFGASVDTRVPGAGYGVAAIGDLDGDGKADVAVATPDDKTLYIMRGLGTGAFEARGSYALSGAARGVVIADLDGDGRGDVAVGLATGVGVLLNTGGVVLAAPVSYGGIKAARLAAGDVSGDGKADVVVGGDGGTQIGLLLGKGGGTFETMRTLTAASEPRHPAIADLDRDGKPDLVVTGWNGQVTVLLSRGGGSFGAPASYLGATDRSVIADFTNDGKLDVLSASLGSNQVSFVRGNGDGTFQPVVGLTMGEGWGAAADFDLDGNQDVAMVLCCNELGVFPGTGAGTFRKALDVHVNAPPGVILVGEVNGDGKADIVNVASGAFRDTVLNGVLNTSR